MSTPISLEVINELIAEARTRGDYLNDVKAFFKSGELAVDFTEKYPKKDAGSLRTSIKQNVDKIEGHPECKLLVTGKDENKRVLLINMDVYNLQQQKDEA